LERYSALVAELVRRADVVLKHPDIRVEEIVAMSSLCLPVETDRLLLRSFARGDLEGLSAYHTLPSMQRYTFSHTRDREQVASALKTMCGHVSLQRPGDTLTLAMEDKQTAQLIGHISLHWSDATAGQGEVRFLINPRHSGQGFAGEALTALFDMAFDHFHIHRLFARCDGRNHHSIKLLQRLGMRLEAHYREHALFQGEWDEELHFAILDREWQRSSKVKELPRHRVA
jgi:RimJ/RimL family protein N-acetyltransferase|tara:strand:- start:6356 stop:7042 length:687 start_codon:yes stop_codon:yes gene_type:complete